MDTEDPAVKVVFPVGKKKISSSEWDRWGEDSHSAVWCEKQALERPGIFIAS